MNDFNKLKEAIKTYLTKIPKNSTIDAHSVLAVLLNIADDIQSYSSNGWIGADTPPDGDNDVWVAYKPIQKSNLNNKDRPICYCVGYYSYVLQRWFVADANKFPSCICEVTYWQPLLEPPKE